MNTTERLQSYETFDADIVEAVSNAAGYQNAYDFKQLADGYGIAGGSQVVYPYGSRNPIEVLRLGPQVYYDDTEVNVYHAPMGNPIGPNMAMRGMRLYEADPSRPLIMVGNLFGAMRPDGKTDAGKVTRAETHKMREEQTLTPLVYPLLRYLEEVQVTTANHLGFSFGADKAAVATAESYRFDQKVPGGVFAEPASLERQPVMQLLKRFIASGSQLDKFVEETGSKPLNQARAMEAGIWGLANFGLGLARGTNRAIANVLAEGGFLQRASDAIDRNPDGQFTMAWGLKSELVTNRVAEDVAHSLFIGHGADRFGFIRVPEMPHAGGDDIDLHAAIMLQGLRARRTA